MTPSTTSTTSTTAPDQNQRILSRHFQAAVAGRRVIASVTFSGQVIRSTEIEAAAYQQGVEVTDVEIEHSRQLPSNLFFWAGKDKENKPIYGTVSLIAHSTPHMVYSVAEVSLLDDFDARVLTAALAQSEEKFADDPRQVTRAWLRLIVGTTEEAIRLLEASPPRVAEVDKKLHQVLYTARDLIADLEL